LRKYNLRREIGDEYWKVVDNVIVHARGQVRSVVVSETAVFVSVFRAVDRNAVFFHPVSRDRGKICGNGSSGNGLEAVDRHVVVAAVVVKLEVFGMALQHEERSVIWPLERLFNGIVSDPHVRGRG
jgi:hypothetical protein